MLISAEFATANMVMKANIQIGKPGAPVETTFSNGASPSPSSAGATSVTAETETRT